ncbi:MAG TPA: hypothetical protein VGJ26_04920 [Pirellulales bacterium]|jgi:hypothetical protein
MMRQTVTAVLLALVLIAERQAAADNEPKVITLSCDGTLTRTYGANKTTDPEALQKTSVAVNLDEQTVFFWAM